MPILFTLLSFALLELIPGSNALLRYSIPEKQDSNTFVADIINDARIAENYTVPSASELKFALLSGMFDQYFTVRETSGFLVTKSSVDRDALCPETPCVMTVEVAIIQPVESFHVFFVEITIEDINDHAPTFGHDSWTISLPENAVPLETLIPIPVARDLDSGVYSVLRYAVSSASNHTFSMQTSTSSDGLPLPHLNLIEKLDRESTSSYSLLITAYDGDSSPKSGTLSITIIVTDVNDNTPRFEFSEYNVTIIENLQVPTVIAKVSATDDDEGINGMLSFEIISPSKEINANLFQINNTSGEVSLVKKLDSDYRSVYTLLISASDQGIEPRATTIKMHIRVEDINTHSPSVTIRSLTKSGQPEVMENLPPGSFVAYASVQDLDRGRNGEATCRSKNSHFVLHLMHTRTYKVLTTAVFDREENDVYVLSIECVDKGTPSLSSVQETEVKVLDQNDNAPLFDSAFYEISIMENVAVGQSILTVSASDKDIGLYTEIIYVLSSPNQYVAFQHDSGGVIVVQNSIDYEQVQEIGFEIIAMNKENPLMSSTATVLIYVHNENDCTPAFTQASYSFGVFENMPSTTDVGILSAIDSDAPPFNEFYYHLAAHSAISSIFLVDPYTGKISTKSMLDRETIAVHQFCVWVTDAHNLTMTSSTNVTIYVADKNDNSPEISFPAKSSDVVYLRDNSPVGHILAIVQASDKDAGVNAQIVYNLTENTDESLFDIDIHSGAISVSRSLAGVKNKNFQLRLTASDRGIPRLSASAILNVKINTSVGNGESRFPLLPKTSAAKSVPYISHQQILIVLGAITAVLVLVLVAAIVWIRCRRKPQSDRYQHPDKLSLQFFADSKPTMKEFSKSNSTADAASKSGDIHNLINITEYTAGLHAKISRSPKTRLWNKNQPTPAMEAGLKENGAKFTPSCPADTPLPDEERRRGQSKMVVSPSSGFETLTSRDDEDMSLSSSSLYQTMEIVKNTQNAEVLSTFHPHMLQASKTSQFHDSPRKTHSIESPNDETPWETTFANSCDRATRCKESRHLREPLLNKSFKTLDHFSCQSCRTKMQLTALQATALSCSTGSPTKMVSPSQNFKGCISGEFTAGSTNSEFRIKSFPLPLKPADNVGVNECRDSSNQTSLESKAPENEDIHIFTPFPCGKLPLTTP